MPSGPVDPRWPKLLSLTVHELRSPLTAVAGYIRMLLTERAGPMPEQQRRLLEEAEKSCARLAALLVEIGELSQLEGRTAKFKRSALDLRTLIAHVIDELPGLRDRSSVIVELNADDIGAVEGDAGRLKTAFTAILLALRRELVSSERLTVRVESREENGRPCVRVTVGDPVRIDQLRSLGPSQLAVFDEWRGGNGLRLANARRIIEAHGGRLWGASEDGKAVAVLTIPLV